MKAKEVLFLLDITRPTLSLYVKQNKIKVRKLHNGFYDYDEKSVINLLGHKINRKNAIYARVSTSKQKKDLENQIETISKFMNSNGIIIDEIYSDIASGMNLNRNSFMKMMDEIVNRKIDKIFITYKDRIARVSFKMIESLCNKFGTKIIILNEINNSKTIEKEFLEEIVSLIHSFSMKMYSKRRKEKLELVAKDLTLEKDIECI